MGLMDGYIKKMQEKAMQDPSWSLDYTDEQIDDMEKQGIDMTKVREYRAEKKIEKEAIEATWVYNLDSLDKYKSVPRDVDSEFFKDTFGKPPMFGKDKWIDKNSNSPLIYAAVVQANFALFEPGNYEELPGVFVFTTDPKYMYDKEWLTEIAGKVSELKKSGTVPDDCKELIKRLRNDQGIFNWEIGKSITGGVQAWCGTANIKKQSELPHGCISKEKIVPFILTCEPRNNFSLDFVQIPGKYYAN